MNGKIIDTNVDLFRWPFRRVHGDETHELVSTLRQHHVGQAWAGSFEGIFHRDLAGANARLAEECHKHGSGLLLPFGSINPNLPDWEDDLRRCHEDHKMRGIRLHPNYHGYKLSDLNFTKLLKAAAERDLIVQIAVIIEDKRTQPPLMQVPAVDLAPLPDLVKEIPKLRLVLLNCFQPILWEVLIKLAATEKVSFEISTLEGVGGIANLLYRLPLNRVLFGSHASLFYFESAILKLKESALSDVQTKSILEENARRLLSK